MVSQIRSCLRAGKDYVWLVFVLTSVGCGSESEKLSQPLSSSPSFWSASAEAREGKALFDSKVDSSFDPLRLCEPVEKSERVSQLEQLSNVQLGSRDVSVARLVSSPEACVLGLLPAALYTNLRTGVPASVLIAQTIQETGWCRSELARRGLNFHGQKAKFSPSYFRYWDGSHIWIESSEDPSGGGGNKISSKFMAFEHPDLSFYSVAERFRVPGLPYNACLPLRNQPVEFARCIGRSWAVHKGYTEAILGHRRDFHAPSRPDLRLSACDLKENEWILESRF